MFYSVCVFESHFLFVVSDCIVLTSALFVVHWQHVNWPILHATNCLYIVPYGVVFSLPYFPYFSVTDCTVSIHSFDTLSCSLSLLHMLTCRNMTGLSMQETFTMLFTFHSLCVLHKYRLLNKWSLKQYCDNTGSKSYRTRQTVVGGNWTTVCDFVHCVYICLLSFSVCKSRRMDSLTVHTSILFLDLM